MNIFCMPIGCYAPNLRMKSTSCYMIETKTKMLLLDMGVGVKSKVISNIIAGKYRPEDITIVVSHNHVDHVAGVQEIGAFMLKFYTYTKIKLYMSNTSEKYYNWYENMVKKYSSVFDIKLIEENKYFYFEDLQVDFCKTNHCEDKLNSFAIKISNSKKSFVYTSDIASVNNDLKSFIKNTDLVMIDAGNPVKRLKSLSGYHGITKENVYEILNSNVGNVYLTHLKACFDRSDYLNSLTDDSKPFVNLVEKGIKFDIFKGNKEFKYNREISALIA